MGGLEHPQHPLALPLHKLEFCNKGYSLRVQNICLLTAIKVTYEWGRRLDAHHGADIGVKETTEGVQP